MPPDFIAIQAEYLLAEPTAERGYLPLARERGMRLVPGSPLAGGFLTGRYGRDDKRRGSDRLNGANPSGSTKLTERNWRIRGALKRVAGEIGAAPATVALAWTVTQPGVEALSLGASRPAQVRDNIAARSCYVGVPRQLAALQPASRLRARATSGATLRYFLPRRRGVGRLLRSLPASKIASIRRADLRPSLRK